MGEAGHFTHGKKQNLALESLGLVFKENGGLEMVST
jgi:hypothetical protein